MKQPITPTERRLRNERDRYWRALSRMARIGPPKGCRRCRTDKPRKEFDLDTSRRDGLQTWCKQCMAEYERGRKGP